MAQNTSPPFHTLTPAIRKVSSIHCLIQCSNIVFSPAQHENQLKFPQTKKTARSRFAKCPRGKTQPIELSHHNPFPQLSEEYLEWDQKHHVEIYKYSLRIPTWKSTSLVWGEGEKPCSLRASASNSHPLLNIPLAHQRPCPSPSSPQKCRSRRLQDPHRPVQDKHNVLERMVPSSRKPRWV